MKFVNPEINTEILLYEPKSKVTEAIRKIVCDKYGIEGDSCIDDMINDIYDELFKIIL